IGCMYSTDDPSTHIFQCGSPTCRKKTYTRWYDFKRHYNGAHAMERPMYWCDFEGCPRGEEVGGRPFPRKDKLNSHVQSMH
ncbi:hypothetical protein CC86DRAFT_258502, partial [Ophiobolus disseminans]